MALVSTHTIPRLLDLLSAGKLETAALMVTHGKSRGGGAITHRSGPGSVPTQTQTNT
jgi:hypothetical protein